MGSFLGPLGAAVGGFFGGPTGAAIGATVGGGLDANQQASDNASSANTFSADQYAKRWQTTTADMSAAGLNPMLAYSQGVGNSPSGQAAPVRNAYEGIGSTASSVASAYQANAQVGLIDQTVNKVKSEIANINSDTERISKATDVLRQQYQNLYAENHNITETGNVLRATVNKLRAEVPAISASEWLHKAQTDLANVNTQLGNLDIAAASKMSNIGREMGQLKPFLELLVSILRSSRR
jgi:hypothetical protein